MSGTSDQNTPRGAVGDGLRGDAAGRLPSLEAQTPGLDEETVATTDADAKAFFGGDRGGTGDMREVARAAGNGEGADEGQPPAGDVRTVYENERQPGEAEPRGGQR